MTLIELALSYSAQCAHLFLLTCTHFVCTHFTLAFLFFNFLKKTKASIFRLNFCKNEFFYFTMIYCWELKIDAQYCRLVTLEYKRAFAIFLLLRWISFCFAHRSPSTCVPSSVCCDSWRKISNINRKIRRSEWKGVKKHLSRTMELQSVDRISVWWNECSDNQPMITRKKSRQMTRLKGRTKWTSSNFQHGR